MSWLGRFAAGGPVPVFPVAGPGARDRVEDLDLDPALRRVASPRHASLLLVAGPVPEEHREALDRVHDQAPHPRATLRWSPDRSAGEEGAAGGPLGDRRDEGHAVPAGESPVAIARRLHRRLLTGDLESEPHRLPDEPPAPWRGEGDHGQGGEGMMGGKPYGRPMAMTGDDLRDGLALDRVPFTVGPFLPALPPGMVLRLVMQGDVVQEAEVLSMPYPQPLPEPFRRARRGEPVAVADLERARAAALLRSVARTLRLLNAHPLAERLLAELVKPAELAGADAAGSAGRGQGSSAQSSTHSAESPSDRAARRSARDLAGDRASGDHGTVDPGTVDPGTADPGEAGWSDPRPAAELGHRLARFRRRLRRTRLFLLLPPGLGALGRERAVGLGGPCGRAAGATVDPRAGLAAYRELDFRPVEPRGDGVRERLLQRLDEAEQALELAARAEACGTEARTGEARGALAGGAEVRNRSGGGRDARPPGDRDGLPEERRKEDRGKEPGRTKRRGGEGRHTEIDGSKSRGADYRGTEDPGRQARAPEARGTGAGPLLDPTGGPADLPSGLEGPEGEGSLPGGGVSGRAAFFRQTLPRLLPGLEWSQAMLVVASLEPVPAPKGEKEEGGPAPDGPPPSDPPRHAPGPAPAGGDRR